MNYYFRLENRLVKNDNNQEKIVGIVNDPILLAEIICLLNGEV